MKRIRLLTILLLCLTLSGCNLRLNWVPGREVLIASDNMELTGAEVRLLCLAYKTEFESYYSELLGNTFWDIEVESGMRYEDYIKEYFVFRECRALIYLGEQAAADKLPISDIEEEMIADAAQKCFKKMSEDDKTFTRASEKDLERLIRYYYIAMQEVNRLSPEESSVSEEESRVADFSVIHLRSREDAETVLQRLSQGESFTSLASECTTDRNISYSAAKGELIPKLDEQVFSMQNGETSEIIEAGGSFYIIRLNNSYNTLLSLNNKRNILAARAFKGWSGFYREQEEKVVLYRNALLWDEIELNCEGNYTDFGFFEALSGLK